MINKNYGSPETRPGRAVRRAPRVLSVAAMLLCISSCALPDNEGAIHPTDPTTTSAPAAQDVPPTSGFYLEPLPSVTTPLTSEQKEAMAKIQTYEDVQPVINKEFLRAKALVNIAPDEAVWRTMKPSDNNVFWPGKPGHQEVSDQTIVYSRELNSSEFRFTINAISESTLDQAFAVELWAKSRESFYMVSISYDHLQFNRGGMLIDVDNPPSGVPTGQLSYLDEPDYPTDETIRQLTGEELADAQDAVEDLLTAIEYAASTTTH